MIDRHQIEGSRLFANCIIAVNASTGQYVWHYRRHPPSGAEFHSRRNLVINSDEQRIMTVPRNGVFYTLDVGRGKQSFREESMAGLSQLEPD